MARPALLAWALTVQLRIEVTCVRCSLPAVMAYACAVTCAPHLDALAWGSCFGCSWGQRAAARARLQLHLHVTHIHLQPHSHMQPCSQTEHARQNGR